MPDDVPARDNGAPACRIDPGSGLTIIPTGGAHGGEPFDQVRGRLSGLHFAKECLTDGERDILSLAEALLNLLDAEAGGYRR
jgi:hypothetical protein